MRKVFLFLTVTSTLLASAYSIAQEASTKQSNIKGVIKEQTTIVENIKSLYVEDVVNTKKIVFNSEVLTKIKATEK